MTQEEMAQRLAVSRQTVSKWESDQSFPEMDKLLNLCDMFSCSLDNLTRGDAERCLAEDTDGYDKHMNRFRNAICAGVFIVLFGVAALLFMMGTGTNAGPSAMIFLCAIVVAVSIFIISGISHGEYVKRHPYIAPFYTQDKIDAFSRKFPFLIALPTVLILLGVIWTVSYSMLTPLADPAAEDMRGMLYVALFLLIISVASPIYIYAGMSKAKLDVDQYNFEYANTPENIEKKRKSGQISTAIMLTATAIFLLWGFLDDAWKICWVVYPVAGVLCGALEVFVLPRRN